MTILLLTHFFHKSYFVGVCLVFLICQFSQFAAAGSGYLRHLSKEPSTISEMICGNAPADILFLLDITDSFFESHLEHIQTLGPVLVDRIRQSIPDSRFSIAYFSDVNVDPFGYPHDTPFVLAQPLTEKLDDVKRILSAPVPYQTGKDIPEAQLVAFLQAAEIEWSPERDANRFIFLFTDGPYHVDGDVHKLIHNEPKWEYPDVHTVARRLQSSSASPLVFLGYYHWKDLKGYKRSTTYSDQYHSLLQTFTEEYDLQTDLISLETPSDSAIIRQTMEYIGRVTCRHTTTTSTTSTPPTTEEASSTSSSPIVDEEPSNKGIIIGGACGAAAAVGVGAAAAAWKVMGSHSQPVELSLFDEGMTGVGGDEILTQKEQYVDIGNDEFFD